MEGFTIWLALVDAIPVVTFAIAMGNIGCRFGSILFFIGAGLSVLAGTGKVLWKLLLATVKKDVRWLNKGFVPLQASGFLLMLISLIVDFTKISWMAVLNALISFPSVLFFVGWLGMMVFMGWFRKAKFQNEDAKTNWIAQIANACGQILLLIGILFA